MDSSSGFKVAIKANNGLYISRVGRDGKNTIEACKSSIDPYSQFMLQFLGGDNVAICADNGMYLSRVDRGINAIEAAKQQIDPYSIFILESLGGNVIALRADTGSYVGRVNRGSIEPVEVQSQALDVQNKFSVTSMD